MHFVLSSGPTGIYMCQRDSYADETELKSDTSSEFRLEESDTISETRL
jgi:hypothetical protein